MKVVVVNGEPCSGKDSFVDFCKEVIEVECDKISSVDKVKEAALILGWNNVKDSKGRKFLHDLKMLSTESFDGPMSYIRNCVKSLSPFGILFIHMREPKEIEKCVKEFNAITVLIMRPDLKKFNNAADIGTLEYDYDFYIKNNSSLDLLRRAAHDFVDQHLQEA